MDLVLNLGLLGDPVFRLPFATGLLLAALLPQLGAFLMLRDEWLAALGLAHLAAAAALAGVAAGLPPVWGAGLGALAGALIKNLLKARGNAAYGFMILAGWSALVLVAANSGVGDGPGHALTDGQLYFAGSAELAAALVLTGIAALALPILTRRLLRARLFPQHEVANRLPAWRWHLGFDLLVALGLAVGTATLGLMGAFALVLVPAWIGFRVATGWRWSLIIATATGILGYVLAFALALILDQPLAPVLVALLLALAAPAALIGAPTRPALGSQSSPRPSDPS